MDDGSGLSSDPQELASLIEELETEISSLEGKVAEEVVKMDKYKVSELNFILDLKVTVVIVGEYSS